MTPQGPPLRVLISADMEGATGVTAASDVEVGSGEWQRFRHLLTGDVNAAALGFLEAGAEEVVVNEAHASARNLVLEELDPRLRTIRGRPKPLGMMEGVAGARAVAFVGYHAAAGQAGILSHTYLASGIVRVTLNGKEAGEGRLNAALASEFGVPVVLVTGDDRACAEASAYAPAAATAIVKHATSRFAGDLLSPAATHELIRSSAAKGLAGMQPPDGVKTPVIVEVELATESAMSLATAIPGVEEIGPRLLRYSSELMINAYRTFKVLTLVIADSVDVRYG